METIEVVASSVEEAIERAAQQLGVEASAVKSEVIDEAKGLFGKPGKVTIRASAVASPKSEPEPAAAAVAEEPTAEAPAEEEEKPKRRTRAKREDKPAEKEAAPTAEAEHEEAKEEAGPDVVASQEDADRLLEILSGMLKAGDLRAEATISALNGRYVHIDVDGPDVGYLIGRRGEVLNSIQYMMNVISARKLNNGVRVVVEGDNYRERRAEMLSDMARRIAAQVLERGEEAVLDALPAFERRVIHQALVEIEGISTYSEGEEPERYVVIAPAG